MTLSLRPNDPLDLEPLSSLLTDAADLSLVNPSAKHPFDPLEWMEKWLAEPDDASFYVLDEAGQEVGFFALRVGVGPEVRHLTYVYIAPEMRGGAGHAVTAMAEDMARRLGARSLSLKVETDNAPALSVYQSAGYEELSRRSGMATMRRDLD
ncbi:GNAT family N-acetyltransferase [Acuticoccus sediminis]|uniref:GNAT family N-acetyltransferase n=1 Tax=Acuticoccus sediminis TaxID=2184697 RepID=UPI001CFD1A3D|nr:GNAT family N-acetyltransferase [Acuticoccus sediminis]